MPSLSHTHTHTKFREHRFDLQLSSFHFQMANPIDLIHDDTFQIDPLCYYSFNSTNANQTGLAIQPSEPTNQPVVLDPLPSSGPDPMCGKVERAELNPIPSSEANTISKAETLFRFNSLITASTRVQVCEAHTPGVGTSDLKLVSVSDLISKSETFIAMETTGVEGDACQAKVSKSSEAQPTRKGEEDVEQQPSWFPENWTMSRDTQKSGITAGAGTTDMYYVEPTTGQRFRSKVEVKRYLETGSKNKSTSDSNATPSETTGKDSEKPGTKKTGTKRKQKAAMSFDFENPPQEVTWTLGPGDGNWKPSIGGEEVPETTVQEWAATFELVTKME